MLRVFISQRVSILIVSSVILAGCSTVEDPSESGGIFSTATGVMGGKYDARLEKKQEMLEKYKAEGQQLETAVQGLESEKLTITQQLEIEKQKLNGIEAAIGQLEKSIQNETTTLTDDEQQREETLRKLNALKQKNEVLQKELASKKNMSAEEVKRLQEERDRLDKELNLLLDISQ